MTLGDIERDITSAPTMMSIDEEVIFFRRLRETSVEDIERNWAAFSRVLDRLYESHLQSFFDVDDNNKEFFLGAAKWLESIAGKLSANPSRVAALLSFAEHFRIDPYKSRK